MKTKETTNRGIGKCIIFLMVILFSTVSFSAHAKSYGFKIDGVEVTSDNYSDLTGGNISGTVKYNPTTNTVTLTNVTINRTISDGRCIDNFNNSGLIVELKGTNNLTAKTSPVKLQKETTFKATSGSTTNIEGWGDNANGIYVTAERGFNVNFEGTGTINIKSDKDAAFWRSSYDSYAPIRAFFKGPKVNIQGVKGDLVNIDVTFSGGEVTLKATNSQSTPNVISCGITLQGKMAILKPWGATVSGNTIKVNNPVYSTDILISSNYVALLTEDYFPDTNFRNFLQNIYTKGYITESDVAAQTSFDLHNKSIGSLTGIKYFTELTTLKVWGNSTLSYVDLTNNKKLEELVCSSCNISTLNIQGLNKLKKLNCSYNALTYVNLSTNTALEDLNIANNSLTSISVSSNTNLRNFDCSGNKLTALGSMSTNTLEKLTCGGNNFTTLTVEYYPNLRTILCNDSPSLKTLKCRYNALTFLYIDGCTNLETLLCGGNKFDYLDVNEFPKLNILDCSACDLLTELRCYKNALTELYVSECNELTLISCSNNNFTTLRINNLPSLAELYCNNCDKLETLDCRYNALEKIRTGNLKNLYIGSNNFYSLSLTESCETVETLDVSNNLQLKSLTLNDFNSLQNLNMSGCPSIEEIEITNTPLTSFDVSGLSNLSKLTCNNNHLETLNISGCTKLKFLNCDNNSLTSLNLQNYTYLKKLNCSNNSLQNLNMSGCSSIEEIEITNTPLTSFDVSGLSNLSILTCNNNHLETLNVSGCTKLKLLNCDNNSLTSLNLQNYTYLQELSCSNNSLNSLNLTNCNQLQQLYCSNNHIESLNLSMNTLVECDCSYNSLTSLNLSGIKIERIYCNDNKLTSLNIPSEYIVYLECQNNRLTSLTVPSINRLVCVKCYGNRLQEQAMNNLIIALSVNEPSVWNWIMDKYVIYAINLGDPKERNIVNKAHVSTAESKGWDIMYSKDGENWTYNYPGTYTPNPIATDVQGVDANKEDNSPRYNLGGQRVKNDYKGIVVVGGKKVVVKE